ncbi:MAG: bifunctional diaminohydroxyphosphoribosylaminopyrimidine deaminase/5-amino-6-(5-phosphoribosylamino)uracil reductase RibD [Niabella sp.]
MPDAQHEVYMARCIELAQRGMGNVAPNPMVGAVLVYNGKIIGEGYHQQYGKAHAEVNCITEALKIAPELIPKATLYVSLEPCAHYGKTPPCADLIIQHKIPKVVIGCRDIFAQVNGSGIEKLKGNGVDVMEGVLEKAAIELNKRFFTAVKYKRPYIVLKWAQTNNGFMAADNVERLMITNSLTKRLVHKWRSEESAILVGAKTVITDNPLLDNRYWYGKSPVKIIIDPSANCDTNLSLFKQGEKVIIANTGKDNVGSRIIYLKIDEGNFLHDLMLKLHKLKIQSVFVEGGRHTLQSFINAGLWDEIKLLTNTKLVIDAGLHAPQITNALKTDAFYILNDRIEIFKKNNAGTGFL